MSDQSRGTGHCLCGAVTMTATRVSRSMGACHCTMCRTWGGGPLLAVDCGTEVTFDGHEHISVFDSSHWAERGFCSKCGTHLFYRLKGNRQYIVPAGLLADQGAITFDHQVFVDEKPAYYDFSNETENMTGAEVFAKFGPSSG